MFEPFINVYSLTKTVCFNLIPTELTKKNMDEHPDSLQRDLARKDNMPKIQEAFDSILNNNVYSSLKSSNIDIKPIKDAYFHIIGSQDENKKEAYKNLRNDIVEHISDFLFKANNNLFNNDTLKTIRDNSDIDIEILSLYSKQYLSKFIESRKESLKNIAKRIVENCEQQIRNIIVINEINKLNYKIPFDIGLFFDNDEIFYDQEVINKYNELIASVNQKLNEDYQKNIIKRFKLVNLKKAVLSNVKTFEIEQYRSNDDVKKSFDKLFSEYPIEKVYQKLYLLFKNKNNYDTNKVYIMNSKIHDLSQRICGNHNIISDKINDYVYNNIKNKKEQEKFKKQNFSIENINKIADIDIFNTIKISNNYLKLYKDFCNCPTDSADFLNVILNLSNDIIDTFSILKIFVNQEDADNNFYNEYNDLVNFYKSFNKVFNCSRNFATKKNEYVKSYIVNFDNNQFGGGWSITKEKDYRCCIFIKDNKYYFGFLNSNKYDFEYTDDINHSYRKMIYMQNSGSSSRTIGKIIFAVNDVKNHFSSSNETMILNTGSCDNLEITREIYDIYCNKTFKTVKADKIKYINFLKDFYLNKYTKRNYFDFSLFKDAEKYDLIEDFYNDVDISTYSVSYKNVSDECIENLQKENKLWLFQIYCQDFSEHKHTDSKKNIHTMIFESFFSEENKNKHYPIQLQGEFEIRYRDEGITDGTIHKKGSILLNKFDKNNNRIPDSSYTKLFKYVNDEKVDLNEEEKEYIRKELLITHVAKYDIIKDRRYINPKYEIHLPFKLNRNADDAKNYRKMNEKLNEYVQKNQCNIIGIDRGERNLLCATVINKDGHVLHRECLDEIDGVNYNNLLNTIEKDRDKSRKTWNSISKIKDVKKGFISLAVKKIVDLVDKYNAIISLENLNNGFINSRVKIEKSIYQQFVNQLINKLAYMVVNKNESIINVKQLAFIGLDDFNHNGIVYYVNPSYTSKIDSNTGFANLFDFSKITNAEKRKEFFSKMNIIAYDNNYCFEFDYKDFDTYNNALDGKKFKVSSYGNRIKRFKNNNGYWDSKNININDELNNIFANTDKTNIKNIILNDEKICSKVFEIFKLIVQLRNTDSNHDYLVSPIKSNYGYYDTNLIMYNDRTNTVCNPDIEASYNIAIKAMLKIYQNKHELKDYFEYYLNR